MGKISLATINLLKKRGHHYNLSEAITSSLGLTKDEFKDLVDRILRIGNEMEKEFGTREARDIALIAHSLLMGKEISELEKERKFN